MWRKVRVALLGALSIAVGCEPNGEAGEEVVQPDPASVLFALEERLTEAERVEVEFHITAEGAVEVDLRGGLVVSVEDEVHLTAEGIFAGQPVELFLVRDGLEYEFGNASDRTSASPPEYLKEALLIGLTRMGILHNLAMLSSGAPPDRSNGGVREWVTLDGFSSRGLVGEAGGPTGIAFRLTVAGIPSGTAEVDLTADGLLAERRQTVEFPEGEMRVVERYGSFVVDP